MNTHKPGRIDHRTAEQLLDRGPSGIPGVHPPVTALLVAAAVPGLPHELAREQATMAAFRTAGLHPIPQPRRCSVIRTAVAKVLTVKVLAVLATTTAGGVALAATTGAVPNPLAQAAPSASSGLSAADPSATRSGGADSPEAKASKDAKVGADASTDSKAPSPSLVGLCHAYGAGNKADHGKALENPAFAVLLTKAGGKDQVEGFCRATLAKPAPSNSPASNGKKPDKDRPTDTPTGRGSGKPAAHPAKPSPTRNH
jgi:hypothetical protein